ncbi:tyrosine-type recombinase/integrase [Dysosmobacter sp.]
MVAGHLQEKRGIYHIVLNLTDESGQRRTKWISTKLPVKGNKRRAEMMLLEERRKYADGETFIRPGRDMQFSDYMLYWLKQIKLEVDISTYAGYKNNVEKRIVPYFRKRQVTLAGLRSIDIKDFYTYCREELNVSNNTVIHYHSNISKALNDAVALDMISMSPMKKGLRPQQVAHNGSFYTLAETERLFEVVRGDGVEFPVLMAAFYGLRREEVAGLKWSCVDFADNTITVSHTVIQVNVDGKSTVISKDRAKNTSSYRTLPLVPQYRELLLRMKAHQEKCQELCGRSYHKSDYIYVNDIGDPIKPNYITQHFAAVLKKNNLRKITFHELRHTCASLLLKNGVAMKDIQAWLGHSNYNTTANIYAHLESASKDMTGATMASRLDISRTLNAAQG